MNDLDRELRQAVQKDLDFDRARVQQRRQAQKEVLNAAYRKGLRKRQWAALEGFKVNN